MTRVKVIISPNGKVEVIPEGWVGESCMIASDPLRRLGQVVSESDLPERYEVQKEKETETC